jgi:hypothetical protein
MKSAANENRSRALNLVLLYSPVLIAILVMLPRLLSPQFGLLDDGKSILTAQDLARGDWGFRFDVSDSRFRPFYWLSFATVYILSGGRPFWFFLLNTFTLCLTVAALIFFMRKQGVDAWQAWLGGVFFVLAGSIFENFYTLSKGEWLQVMFISMSLAVIALYSTALAKSRKILLVAVTTLFLLSAVLSKETSVVMWPVSCVWAVVAWLWTKRRDPSNQFSGWRVPYLLSSTIAVLVYVVLRFLYTTSATTTSGYTTRYNFMLSQLMVSSVRWAGWITRDHFYLGVIILLAVVLIVLRRDFPQRQLAVDMLIWMVAWVAVYLPWHFMTEYYLLPFSIGTAVFSGLILGDRLVWQKPVTTIIAVLAILLLVVSVMNNWTTARIQLAVDDANSKMMDGLASLPPHSRVFVNIQSANEYTDQIAMQMVARFGRNDLVVDLLDPASETSNTCLPGSCYIVSPIVQNQPLLTVRMGVYEPTQVVWNESLESFINQHPGWAKAQEFKSSVGMMTIEFPRLFCRFISTRAFCATPSPLIDNRTFMYGWELYQLRNDQ